MQSVIVTTKDQLEKAKQEKVPEIIVVGDLADSLKRSQQITKLSAIGLAVLATSIATIPLSGGLSSLALISGAQFVATFAAPIAAYTGVEIAAIIAAVSLGVALILAIFKEYDVIEYESGKLILRRKRS